MILFIDGAYLYEELAYRARKQQEIVYESKQPIGCVQPINNYVLVFDTTVRIILQWEKLLNEIQKRYEVDAIVLIKKPLHQIHYKKFVMMKRKRLNPYEYRQAVQEIIDNFNYCGNRFPYRLQEMFENVATYFDTYTDRQWGKLTKEYMNKTIKELIHIYAIDQTYLHQLEHEYIYNIFCSRFDTVCDSAEFSNALYLSNCRKKNVEVFNINFEVKSKIRRTITVANFETIEVTENRKINEVADSIYPYVLYFYDENILPVVADVKSTYHELKRLSTMDPVALPRSMKKSDYSMLSGTFLSTCKKLHLEIERYI